MAVVDFRRLNQCTASQPSDTYIEVFRSLMGDGVFTYLDDIVSRKYGYKLCET